MDYILEYRARILDKVQVTLTPQSIVLDIGCGEGWHGLDFAKTAQTIIGMDITPSPVWRKIKQKNLHFVISNTYSLPFRNEMFDRIYLKDVLHHLEDPDRAFKEIMRVTKREGEICLIEANRYNPLLYLRLTLRYDHQHFTQEYFMKFAQKYSKNVKFMFSETHALPIKTKFLRRIFYSLEDFIEKIPLFRKFLAYNIATIVKEV